MDATTEPSTGETEQISGISELLLLPDGRILVHNLTPECARWLSELNPDDPQILPRASHQAHEHC